MSSRASGNANGGGLGSVSAAPESETGRRGVGQPPSQGCPRLRDRAAPPTYSVHDTYGGSPMSAAHDATELLTAQEAARLLRISPVTVYQGARERPEMYGRVQLGGREVRLRASAIRRLLGELPVTPEPGTPG